MCGIVGHVVREGNADTSAVKAGMAAMVHRGPDGEGIVQLPQICFGHRRLSIIDIAGSPQPWQSADGRYTMVFNGEIYNYLELRAGLEKKGFTFRSQGDTEVLLTMYMCYGADCLGELNGMFAFAIWDELEKKLFLARDRLGKKPLYYAITNTGLVFASEIGALHKFHGIDTTINTRAVHDFFAHQFIGEDRSIYRGIRKLRAGHYFIYSGGTIETNRYWTPPYPVTGQRTLPDLCEEFRALLDDAVRLRLRSDVPLGCFLSGGLDSALVLASMKHAGVDIQSFTVGFRDTSFDESTEAQETAHYFSTNHRNRIIDINAATVLEDCLTAFGEPFADPSALPVNLLCQHARQHVTVALSGDGVDELFGGYRRYYARRWVQYVPAYMRSGLIMNLLSGLPEGDSYYGQSRLKQIKLFCRLIKALEESPRDPLPQVFTLGEQRELFAGDMMNPEGFDYHAECLPENADPVSQMMLTDIQTYLVDDILVKVDRMSMHHSLEVRSPFLDYRILEFASRLPVEFKIRGSVQKYMIRECYRDLIPANILSRRKHGFALPLTNWFRGMLKPVFESMVFDVACPDFLNIRVIRQIWQEHQSGRFDHGFKLWCVLVFFHWYNTKLK